MGTVTGAGNGLQGARMADTSLNSSFFYKANFELAHLKKTKHIQDTHRPIFNLNIARIVLLPLLSVILITIGRWFTKMSSLKCVNFKFRYLFFNKSRKCVSKHKIAFAVHKLFLFFLIALTFDVKVPSKTYYNMESEMRTYHELFTEEYFAIAESTRTNCMKELSSLYALSKLKYSKHCWYFQYLLLLSGDINLHPGPTQYPSSMCTRAVRKGVVCCVKCGLWVHKKCYTHLENVSSDSSYICRPCKHNNYDSSDNIWQQFPFGNDCLEDIKTIPSESHNNPNLDTSSSTDNWKVFNKRGLYLIHLNINSIISKIDELCIIAKKSRASVIGITESKLDETILDEEINIDGYELARSDRNRHGGGVVCYIRNDISFNVRGDFSSEIENIFSDIFLPKTKPILIGILYRPPG